MILALTLLALADPCGMVPPIHVDDDGRQAIERTDDQRTYVFFKDGIETMALRPGFVGKVDQFGMLIPFPSAPELRKIDDDLFAQIEAAVDPPEVEVTLRDPQPERRSRMDFDLAEAPMAMAEGMSGRVSALGYHDLAPDAVRVVREEAVGMYQAAVLEAGSAQAMQRWMDENGYRYPSGMELTVDDYLSMRWCFVAIKANIGTAAGLDPRPGMRATQGGLPTGSQFDGHVQGMAFRFEIDEPVVPMRLSVFNGGEPNNVVYVLADVPVRFARVPRDTVVRQVDGREVHANLTKPLPVHFRNGKQQELREADLARLDSARDPEPYNGKAADLFASDLLAARSGQLSLALEREEKALVNISEELGLRGELIDGYVADAMDEQRGWASRAALADLEDMTLTVIDGQLDPELLATTNLTFYRYTMPWDENQRRDDSLRRSGEHLVFTRVASVMPDIVVPSWDWR